MFYCRQGSLLMPFLFLHVFYLTQPDIEPATSSMSLISLRGLNTLSQLSIAVFLRIQREVSPLSLKILIYSLFSGLFDKKNSRQIAVTTKSRLDPDTYCFLWFRRPYLNLVLETSCFWLTSPLPGIFAPHKQTLSIFLQRGCEVKPRKQDHL